MRCLACGHEMEVTQTEPHEFLLDVAYYSFKCPGCADLERRLLPRGQVSVTEILRSTTQSQAPQMPKPQEKICRKST